MELFKLDRTKLKNRFLCEDHFLQENLLQKKLVKNSVPIKYTDMEILQPTTSYSTSRPSSSTRSGNFDLQIASTSANSDDSDEQILKDITNMPVADSPQRKTLKRKMEAMSETITSMKTKLKKQKLFTSSLNNLNLLPTFPKALVTMQLSHKKRKPWLSSEKMVALSIYYKSPSTYKFMRSKKVNLPSPSTLSTWLKSFRFRPGINKGLMKCIKLKVDTMKSQNRVCVVAFDEMALKQCLEFSNTKDYFDGYEDLGRHGRKPVLAKQALVFMVRGIYSSWKIPVAFYFSENGVKADILKELIEEVLCELKKTGLQVLAVISDQASTNQKVYKLLGVTPEMPYFFIRESKYLAIFDVPHLIKNIRNNLLDCNYLWEGSKLVSFDYVREVYAIDKTSNTGKALPKLTDNHMNPGPFQKMSVRLATQVFSHSVSAAMRTAIETQEIDKNAEYTAAFISIIDSCFDALNSRNLKDKKKCRRALSDKNSEAFHAMNVAKEAMLNLQKVDKSGNLKRVACFDGLIQTINAVEIIFNDQKKKRFQLSNYCPSQSRYN